MWLKPKFKAMFKNAAIGKVKSHFSNAAISKIKKKIIKKNKIDLVGPIATFLKYGNSS